MLESVGTDAPPADAGPETVPEAPTLDSPASVDDGQAPPESAGQPRDASGRFAPRAGEQQAPDAGGTPADGPDDAAPDGNAPEPPDAPDAQAGTAPGAHPAPATATAPEHPTAPPEPFAFQHRGDRYALEGAARLPDGAVRFDPAAVPRLTQLLTTAREFETFGRQREQQFTAEIRRLSEQTERKGQFEQALDAVFNIADDREFLDTVYLLRQQLPALKAQTLQEERDAYAQRVAELEGRAPARRFPDDAAPDPQRFVAAIHGTITQKLDAATRVLPEFQGLPDADAQRLFDQVARRAGLFVREATAEDEMTYGTPRGTPVFDDDAFVAELRLVAQPVLHERRQQAAKAKAEAEAKAAAKRNALLATPPKLPPNPTPGATTAPANRPKFETEEEYERWLHS